MGGHEANLMATGTEQRQRSGCYTFISTGRLDIFCAPRMREYDGANVTRNTYTHIYMCKWKIMAF